jgi:hypothetical protein
MCTVKIEDCHLDQWLTQLQSLTQLQLTQLPLPWLWLPQLPLNTNDQLHLHFLFKSICQHTVDEELNQEQLFITMLTHFWLWALWSPSKGVYQCSCISKQAWTTHSCCHGWTIWLCWGSCPNCSRHPPRIIIFYPPQMMEQHPLSILSLTFMHLTSSHCLEWQVNQLFYSPQSSLHFMSDSEVSLH